MQPKKGNSDIDLRPKGNISMRPSTAPMRRQWKGRKGRHLEFLVSGNWGAPQPAIGLSGLEVLDAEFNKIEIAPRLISMMGTYVNYNCSMLLNENKITSDPNEMWIVEVANDGEVSIHIDLGMEYDVGGLKVWNYNAGQEERCEGGGSERTLSLTVANTIPHPSPASLRFSRCSCFGVKRMRVYLDGKLGSPEEGFLIRKAPGYANFDFGQFLALNMGAGGEGGSRCRAGGNF